MISLSVLPNQCLCVGVSVCVRRRRKSTAKVHCTNLVVLESSGSSLPQEKDSDMGNKSSGFSPQKKQKGGQRSTHVHVRHCSDIVKECYVLPDMGDCWLRDIPYIRHAQAWSATKCS